MADDAQLQDKLAELEASIADLKHRASLMSKSSQESAIQLGELINERDAEKARADGLAEALKALATAADWADGPIGSDTEEIRKRREFAAAALAAESAPAEVSL